MSSNPALMAVNVPLALIDDPEVAMRETMDEQELANLAESIRQLGLLQPVVLRPRGVRYEIIAGHRRTVAARRAGLVDVPAMVGAVDDETVEAMKMAENVDRENVGPAEEATYLATILEKFCANDFDRLVTLTRRSESYLNDRLALLSGSAAVLEALRAKQINLSVATELNRYKDEIAGRQALELAIAQGATGRAVRDWRRQYELVLANNAAAIAAGDAVNAAIPAASTGMPRCIVCHQDNRPEAMRMHYVHEHCNLAILEPMLSPQGGRTNG